jgi:hypothetical protein
MPKKRHASIPSEKLAYESGLEKSDPTHLERALDEALEETFPASDPVAVSFNYVIHHPAPKFLAGAERPTTPEFKEARNALRK